MNDDAVLNQTMEVEYNRFKDSALEEDGVKPLTFTLDDEPHGIRYKVAVRTPRIGEGPWINGQQFSPYLSPKEHELLEQWPWGYSGPELPDGEGGRAIVAGFTALPDLIDAWGQPIIVFRRERDSGPVLLADDTDTRLPQFRLNGIDRYLAARNLGRQQEPQRCDSNEPARGSRIGDDSELHEREYWLYLLLSHPAMRWEWEDSSTPVDCIGTGRAGYAMLSAGPDGIFFSRYDGPRTDDDGVPIAPGAFPADSEDPAFGKDHKRLKEFDDVVMYGGS
jgi:hypothetical protein